MREELEKQVSELKAKEKELVDAKGPLMVSIYLTNGAWSVMEKLLDNKHELERIRRHLFLKEKQLELLKEGA